MNADRLVLGTRGSQLALWQSNHVKNILVSHHPSLSVELTIVKTLGDKILDSPLSRIGDKGLFTKELERHLLDGTIDLAVHSLKDLPTTLPAGLTIGAVTKREDVHDVFIAHPKKHCGSLLELPHGAAIATGSLRRRCQLLHLRPDLHIVELRGNLNTRLEKLEASDWDGMILARAGLTRLGFDRRMTEVLGFDIMLPAVGQGALAIEVREDDARVRELLRPLHDNETFLSVLGERSLLRRLEGGCQVPIGAYGRMEEGEFVLDALIGNLEGTVVVRGTRRGRSEESETVGESLAEELLSRGGRTILEEITRTVRGIISPDV